MNLSCNSLLNPIINIRELQFEKWTVCIFVKCICETGQLFFSETALWVEKAALEFGADQVGTLASMATGSSYSDN